MVAVNMTIITWVYLAGLWQADGTIIMEISNTGTFTFKPEFRISQATNTNTLKLIFDFYALNGITSKIIYINSPDRAPTIQVSGKDQVLKIIKNLKETALFNFNGLFINWSLDKPT